MMQSLLARQLRGASVRGQPLVSRVRFSTRPARLAPDAAAGAGSAKPRKRHRIRNLFLATAALVVGGYAGGVYYALHDDEFYDKFTVYVPLADFIVGFVDDWKFWLAVKAPDGDYRRTWDEGQHKPIKTVAVDGDSKANPERYDSKTGTVQAQPDTAGHVVEQPAGKPASKAAARPAGKDGDAIVKVGDAARTTVRKATQAGKEPSAAPQDHASAPVDPQVMQWGNAAPAKVQQVPNKTVEGVGKDAAVSPEQIDPLLQSIVRQVKLAEQAKSVDLLNESYFKSLGTSIKEASISIKRERELLKREFEASLKKQTSTTRATAEQQYLAAKLNLVDSYNRRLQLALDAVTQKAVAAANNRIAAQYTELQRVFEHEISDRVEHERNGRLAQLGELKKDVETLQEAMLSSGRIIESEDGVVSFYLALGDLQRVLSSGKTVPLKPYLDTLTKALPSDPLVNAVVASVAPTVKQYGVLSHTQLAARFALIEPEIRKASLVQPDAGIAGHIGSVAASQLLVKKQGLPEGDDVESVLARTSTYLQQGDVVQAVAEANTLQGWPKKIAGDWLAEARRRSEVEFLLNVLSEEGRLWSISRTKK